MSDAEVDMGHDMDSTPITGDADGWSDVDVESPIEGSPAESGAHMRPPRAMVPTVPMILTLLMQLTQAPVRLGVTVASRPQRRLANRRTTPCRHWTQTHLEARARPVK